MNKQTVADRPQQPMPLATSRSGPLSRTIVSARLAAELSPRDLVGRTLMCLAALAAAATAVGAIVPVLDAPAATKIIETWRLYGFLVFAGLFALLAARPRRYRWVWELVILNKLALTATALGYLAHGGIDGAGTVICSDGGLTIVLVAGYVCCRGWSSGSARALAPDPSPASDAR